MSGALSKLILIFAFVSQSTLAVGPIHYKLADLPDFHRDDGYGDMSQGEVLLALDTSYNRYSQLHEIRILPEQTVNAGSWFFLDVSQSVVQIDGFFYKWRQTAGKKVLINRSDSIRAWVQTPSHITRDETLEFELMVTDDKGKYVVATHTVFLTAIVGSPAQLDNSTLTRYSQS